MVCIACMRNLTKCYEKETMRISLCIFEYYSGTLKFINKDRGKDFNPYKPGVYFHKFADSVLVQKWKQSPIMF